MLQIDHIYEFFNSIFKNIEIHYFYRGIIEDSHYYVFTKTKNEPKILFYDQEPLVPGLTETYFKAFRVYVSGKNNMNQLAPDMRNGLELPWNSNSKTIVVSEKSEFVDHLCRQYDLKQLYYFYHGYAALDWYRGYYTLNYDKPVVRSYKYEFISMNRIIIHDRSYRIYFISLLKAQGLLEHGQVSFNVTDNLFDEWQDEVADPNTRLSEHACQHIEQYLTDINKLVIDNPQLPGSASADILRDVDAFWHIVTETVFYYNKLHLTEKIFKPIVNKQPFMLLAAPGNLEYLRSYGFKTFDGIIDESYDNIIDNDLRTEAVVKQLTWYCNLSSSEKTDIISRLEPIIEHNFHHFYGEFKHIITRELLDNTKTLFQSIAYDDSHINYDNIYHALTH